MSYCEHVYESRGLDEYGSECGPQEMSCQLLNIVTGKATFSGMTYNTVSRRPCINNCDKEGCQIYKDSKKKKKRFCERCDNELDSEGYGIKGSCSMCEPRNGDC